MQELLLVNPGKRPSKRRSKRASPAQKRARAAFAAAARARSKNPVRRHKRRAASVSRAPVIRRKRNPIRARSRRQRNPINLRGFAGSVMGDVKDAAIGGAGAVAVDILAGYGKTYLPTSLQSGIQYSAVKALATVALGMVARKFIGPMGSSMARGALTVQAYGIMLPYVPAGIKASGGLGYLSPSGLMLGARSGKPIAATGGGMNGLRGGFKGLRALTDGPFTGAYEARGMNGLGASASGDGDFFLRTR